MCLEAAHDDSVLHGRKQVENTRFIAALEVKTVKYGDSASLLWQWRSSGRRPLAVQVTMLWLLRPVLQSAENVYAQVLEHDMLNTFLHMVIALHVRHFRKNNFLVMLHVACARVR